MQLSDLRQKFQALKEKEADRTKFIPKEKDPRILNWTSGHTYKMRLLFWVPDGGERSSPFIYQYRHAYYDRDSHERGEIICPTSEYISDRKGFDQCKTCSATNNFYKDFNKETKKWESASSKALYDQFKRRFYGFALVYVINDPSNEANNGHVRIMPFGDTIGQFLRKKIFGVEKVSGKLVPVKDLDDVIEFAAFDLEKGYNLHVAVTPNASNPKWNDYSPEFARKETDTNISIEDIEEEIKSLNFDKDFYRHNSPAEQDIFYKSFVVREEVKDEVDVGGDEATPPGDDEKPVSRVLESKGSKASAPLPDKDKTDEIPLNDFKEEKKPAKKVEKSEPKADMDVDFSDIDALLEKADKAYGKK